MQGEAIFQFSPYALPPLIGCTVLPVLSLLVFSRRRRGGPQVAFALVNLAVALWNLDILLVYILKDPALILVVDRVLQPAIVVIPLALVNFVTAFLNSRHRRLLVGIYLLWSIMLVGLTPTHLLISGSQLFYFGHYGLAGPLYFLYVITHLSALAVATLLLFLRWRKTADAVIKNQIGCVLLATVVLGILSADNFLPLYGVERYPVGNIAVIIYLVVIGLAVIRYRFMDIRTVVRQSLIYSIATFLLTALYVGLILLLESLVRAYLLPDSLLIPLVPALLVGFMFRGVKERVQSRLDGIFGHEKKRTALLSSFARSARSTSSRSELTRLFCQRMHDALRPHRQALFTRDLESGRWRTECDGGLEKEDLRFITDDFLPAAVSGRSDISTIAEPLERYGERPVSYSSRVSQMGFHLLVPLKGRSTLAGACLLGQKASGRLFAEEDRAFIEALSGQVATALEAREYWERWRREEKFTSLGRASATISHEIRNPLNVINGAVLYLKERYREKGISRFMDIIGQEVAKTTSFVEQLLTASRVPPAHRCIMEVTQWTRRFAVSWNDRYPGIKVEVLAPPVPVHAEFDPLLIEQLLENLFRNAAEAMDMKGSITLGVEVIKSSHGGSAQGEQAVAANMVAFSVTDQGPGIEDDFRGTVFDPFYTTKATGTGLGLCVVDGVVRAHGGYIETESPPGGGACFKVFLPTGTAVDSRSYVHGCSGSVSDPMEYGNGGMADG